MQMHNVRIEDLDTDQDVTGLKSHAREFRAGPARAKVFLDDKEVHGVTAVTVHDAVNSLTKVTIEMYVARVTRTQEK